jgi:GNAT superfamily N-acetyltransferase
MVRSFYDLDRHPFDERVVVSALGPLLADDSLGQVWLLIDPDGSEPCGYAVVTWGYSLESGGREALLDELYVRERDRGTGSRALPQILAAATAAGAVRLFLETEAHNEAVRRFYRRHGLVAEDSVWMSVDL